MSKESQITERARSVVVEETDLVVVSVLCRKRRTERNGRSGTPPSTLPERIPNPSQSLLDSLQPVLVVRPRHLCQVHPLES